MSRPLIHSGMVCLIESSSHQIRANTIQYERVSEMLLAARRTGKVPDNNLTYFDKGFYPPGLLHN